MNLGVRRGRNRLRDWRAHPRSTGEGSPLRLRARGRGYSRRAGSADHVGRRSRYVRVVGSVLGASSLGFSRFGTVTASGTDFVICAGSGRDPLRLGDWCRSGGRSAHLEPRGMRGCSADPPCRTGRARPDRAEVSGPGTDRRRAPSRTGGRAENPRSRSRSVRRSPHKPRDARRTSSIHRWGQPRMAVLTTAAEGYRMTNWPRNSSASRRASSEERSGPWPGSDRVVAATNSTTA